MKRIVSLLAILAVLCVFSVGIISAQDDASIADVITMQAEGDEAEFTILLQLLEEFDLLDTLGDADAELTVFAPTDAAFEALFEELGITVEDLIDIPDFMTDALLYHVLGEVVLSEDMENEMELETVNGASIVVTINDDDEILLNDSAMITTADIEATNGVIHVIDAVLVPPSSEQGACMVSTDQARFASVRVGPGENRTSVTFLPENTEIEVLGQSEDDDGNIWFQVDKETAAAGRSINEAWVAADQVETSGNCSEVANAAAPPIIPIINRPPASTSSGSSDSGSGDGASDTSGGDTTVAPSGSLPNSGSWTLRWNEFTDASCTGTGNVPIPTKEIFGASGMSQAVSVRRSGSSFVFLDTSMEHIGNGVYYGSSAVPVQGGSAYGTIYINQVVNPNMMVGTFIASFDNCNATIGFVANHN